jgi:hypothetical protein
LHEQLPTQVRALADKNFKLLQSDPGHPSLQLKKVGRYWSVRIGRDYRALAREHDGNLLWFWIGAHAEYDRLLKQS